MSLGARRLLTFARGLYPADPMGTSPDAKVETSREFRARSFLEAHDLLLLGTAAGYFPEPVAKRLMASRAAALEWTGATLRDALARRATSAEGLSPLDWHAETEEGPAVERSAESSAAFQAWLVSTLRERRRLDAERALDWLAFGGELSVELEAEVEELCFDRLTDAFVATALAQAEARQRLLDLDRFGRRLAQVAEPSGLASGLWRARAWRLSLADPEVAERAIRLLDRFARGLERARELDFLIEVDWGDLLKRLRWALIDLGLEPARWKRWQTERLPVDLQKEADDSPAETIFGALAGIGATQRRWQREVRRRFGRGEPDRIVAAEALFYDSAGRPARQRERVEIESFTDAARTEPDAREREPEA